jgi:hypothetical protein
MNKLPDTDDVDDDPDYQGDEDAPDTEHDDVKADDTKAVPPDEGDAQSISAQAAEEGTL